MNLTMEVRTAASTAVITCSGSLVLGERIDALRATVYELLYRYEQVVIDVERVHRIDGAGLGVVAGAAAMAVISGRTLSVAGASGIVDESLTITRLNTAFETHGSSRRYAAA